MKRRFLLICVLVASLGCQAGPGPVREFPDKPPLPGGIWPFKPGFIPGWKDNLLDAKPVIIPPATVVVPIVGQGGDSEDEEDCENEDDCLKIDVAAVSADKKSKGRLAIVDSKGNKVYVETDKGAWRIKILYDDDNGKWTVKDVELIDPQGKKVSGFTFESKKGSFPGLDKYGVYEDQWTGLTWIYGYAHEWRTDIQIRGLE